MSIFLINARGDTLLRNALLEGIPCYGEDKNEKNKISPVIKNDFAKALEEVIDLLYTFYDRVWEIKSTISRQ